jgi:hypothetical protein
MNNTFTCVLISDAYFSDIVGSDEHGAVAIGLYGGPLFVHASTFINCSAPGDLPEQPEGGALYVAAFCIEVDLSCFIGARSDRRGSAVFVGGTHTVNTIRESTFANCGDPDSICDGTLYFWGSVFIEFNLLNVSECSFSRATGYRGRGYFINSPYNEEDAWAVRYCTVVDCSGADAIHSSGNADGTVEYCNFFGNSVHSDRGVLYAYKRGYVVRFCVFNGDAREIYSDPEYSPVFEVIGCLFSSASFPEGNFSAETWGNSFGVSGYSLSLSHVASHDCPAKVTKTPSLTPTGRFLASATMSASSEIHPSGAPSGSSPMTASLGMNDSVPITPSGLDLSDAFPNSGLPDPSAAPNASVAFSRSDLPDPSSLPEPTALANSEPIVPSALQNSEAIQNSEPLDPSVALLLSNVFDGSQLPAASRPLLNSRPLAVTAEFSAAAATIVRTDAPPLATRPQTGDPADNKNTNLSGKTDLGLIIGVAVGAIALIAIIIVVLVRSHHEEASTDSAVEATLEAPSEFSGSIAPDQTYDADFQNPLTMVGAASSDSGGIFAAAPDETVD